MMIEDILASKITLDDFIDEVYTICSIIPILDALHAAKSGRSRIMNALMKLRNSCDLIDVNTLKIDLELNNNVLNDKATLGKMKDVYPLNLFTCKNVLTKLGNGKKSAGFYLFEYSLLIEIFRNAHMKIEFRMMLADNVHFELLELLTASDNLPLETGFRKNSKTQNRYIYLIDQINFILFRTN